MVETYLARDYSATLKYLESGACTLIAGGTDLMVKRKREAGLLPKFDGPLVFLDGLSQLKGIERRDGLTVIGAGTPLETIGASELVPPMLREAIQNMATPAIRHVATLGGNIANASPAGDTLPVLYLYDAMVRLESLGSIREVPIREFILGPGRTARRQDELIKCVVLRDHPVTASTYCKVGGRKSDAISKLSFAATADVRAGKLMELRAAFGAVGPTVVRVEALEVELIGQDIARLKVDMDGILAGFAEYIRPIDDQRSTALYRKRCALRLLEDFIRGL